MNISVVICTYNYAHFLKDALRAVAAQRFSDFELVIVDDGSTDDTEDAVKRFSDRFRVCNYVKKPHSGLAHSRNLGVSVARGSHVSFLDADDLWSPDYLSTIQAAFRNEPCAELVVSDGLRVRDTGEVEGNLFPAGLPALHGQTLSARNLFSLFPYAAPSATTFTKSLYERIGPFDGTLPSGAEDWHWLIRAARANAFCIRTDRKLVIYRQHETSLARSHWQEMFEGWLRIYSELLRNAAINEPDLAVYGRRITYPRVIRMLSRCRPAEGRSLLKKTMETFGSDLLLQTASFLTFFGLCEFANWARTVKDRRGKAGKRTIIDLSARPETLFAEI